VLSGHDDFVTAALFSSNGAHIVTASADKTARIWDAQVPADLPAQIAWQAAAQVDPLSDIDRIRLGLPPDPYSDRSRDSSACDRAAAAFSDPQRRAPGTLQSDINGDIARPACAAETAKPEHSARSDYQLGRALLANSDTTEARSLFELAVSKGYPAARVDLATLLIDPSAGTTDPTRAVSLYARAWTDGVPIAASALGHLFEHGVSGPGNGALSALRADPAKAWSWYRKGADVGEPNALARFAERDEKEALAEQRPLKARALLLEAFGLYTDAAERAHAAGWPDGAWRKWRYRRATLARLLAREGMMQEVADRYIAVRNQAVLQVERHLEPD
jgi:TPR repeat protein